MTENRESREAARTRMESQSRSLVNGYTPREDFSAEDARELRRLAKAAWLRMETTHVKGLVAEFHRRNDLSDPPTETYNALVEW